MLRHLFDRLLRLSRRREFFLLALAFAALAGFVASEVYRFSMEEDYRDRFNDHSWFAAANLEAETMHGRAMGTVLQLGLNEQDLKELVRGKRLPDDPECLRRLGASRLLLNADGIHVVDSRGIVVAHETTGKRLTGADVSMLAYWQQAIRGNEIVYPVAGSRSRDRSLYIAAPIRGSTSPASELIGVVVAETAAAYLDRRLGLGSDHALLLSPQGVVFAATDNNWLFRMTHAPSAEELEGIGKLRQFGVSFENGASPRPLPFDVEGAIVEFDGNRYSKAMAPVRWNDTAGDWTLVTLGDLRAAVSVKQRSVVGLFVMLLMLAVMELFRRAIHYEAASREALVKAETAAMELESAARRKSQLSEITISLQHAREPRALAETFLRQLADLMPLHQGSLYFIDSIGDGRTTLCLAGSYGTNSAPERVSFGENLLGQCALEHRPLVFSNVPPGFWRVSSGLGGAIPGVLMLFPLQSNNVLLGVLEVASLEERFAARQPVIESLLPVLGMNLEILLAERLSNHTFMEACSKAEQFKAQQKIGQEMEDWFRTVMDGSADGIIIVDATGTVVRANPAALAIFGYEAEEMPSLNVDSMIPETIEPSGWRARLLEKAGGNEAAGGSGWRSGDGLRKDGSRVALSVSVMKLPESSLHGSCICVIARPGTPAGDIVPGGSGYGTES